MIPHFWHNWFYLHFQFKLTIVYGVAILGKEKPVEKLKIDKKDDDEEETEDEYETEEDETEE